jgi:copper chaperone CopZ
MDDIPAIFQPDRHTIGYSHAGDHRSHPTEGRAIEDEYRLFQHSVDRIGRPKHAIIRRRRRRADEPPRAPHTPALVFYLSGANEPRDADAIRAAVTKLKTATVLEVNAERGYAHIRFDSHVVSYHQVAQAIADAGVSRGMHYDPYLIFHVPDYTKANNATGVDAVFAGKKLRTRALRYETC